ncbi:MAG TPA: amidohydrolase family protein, partial [Bryobacteraceae bacterium]
SATESAVFDLGIKAGRVSLTPPQRDSVLDLRGYLILPGLINAHDHLEFNLFPRLGRGPYPNATAWAEDIYRPELPPIMQHLRVPKAIRLFWGGLKNLLAGATTVMHHNPYEPEVFGRRFPVRVVRRYGWAHSLRFSPRIAEPCAATPPGAPFVLHACEGTDAEAQGELGRIDAAGALGPSTAIVHGVALDGEGIALMRQRRSSLVWCPTSNCFTLGRTIAPDVFQSAIPVVLGTDSALTADGDMADELRAALRYTNASRLYEMVTERSAKVLRLPLGWGRIQEGGPADLLAVRDLGGSPADALAALDPELVLVGGRIRMIAPALTKRFNLHKLRLEPIAIEGRGVRLVACNVRALMRAASAAIGGDIRLAGKRVTV